MFPSIRMFLCASSLLFLYSLLVSADNVVVEWAIPSHPYPDATAQVGDSITFDWNGTHNVYIHPSGDCSTTGATEVGTTPGASYTFVPSDAGQDITFACDVDSHCDAGMIITVSVGGRDANSTTPVHAPTSGMFTSPTTAADNSGGSILPMVFVTGTSLLIAAFTVLCC